MDDTERLEGWKEIADYLGRSERTAQRWHSEMGLPVHRLKGPKRAIIYAVTAEIDEWRRANEASPQKPSARPGAPLSWLHSPRAKIVAIAAAVVISAILLNPTGLFSTSDARGLPSPDPSKVGPPPAVLRHGSPSLTRLSDGFHASVLSPPSFPEGPVIAHWGFDEVADGRVIDISGNGHDAFVFNAELVRSPSGHALAFKDLEDLAIVNDEDDLGVWHSYTLEAVLRIDGVTRPGFAPILTKGTPAYSLAGYHLFVSTVPNEGWIVYFKDCSSPVLGYGEWHRVAYVSRGGSCRLYVDGILEDEGKASAESHSDYAMQIGSMTSVVGSVLNGAIDELRVASDDLDPIYFLPLCKRNHVQVIDGRNSAGFSTIQEAVDYAADGARIEVGSGNYNESVTIANKNHLSMYSKCEARVDSFRISDSAGVQLSGFRIAPNNSNRDAVIIREGRSHNLSIIGNWIDGGRDGVVVEGGNISSFIRLNYIEGNSRYGVRFVGPAVSPHHLESNVIRENGSHGVAVSSESDVAIPNNRIEANAGYGVFRPRFEEPHPRGVTLINNTILDNHGDVVDGTHSIDLANYDQLFDTWDSGNTTTCSCEVVKPSAGPQSSR